MSSHVIITVHSQSVNLLLNRMSLRLDGVPVTNEAFDRGRELSVKHCGSETLFGYSFGEHATSKLLRLLLITKFVH